MDVSIVFSWLADFFDQQFVNLLLATALFFLVMFITWWIYRKLSTRNIFLLFSGSKKRTDPSGWDFTLYAMKYFLLFPLLTFIGFLIFAFSLFLLVKPVTPGLQNNILFIAIIMVSTIRVSAYVHESLAEDLAKLVPLSLFAVALTSPSEITSITGEQMLSFVMLIPSVLKYLLFIVILEFLLRGGTWFFSHLRADSKSGEDGEDASSKE